MRTTEATKSAARRAGRIDGETVDGRVRDLVWSSHTQVSVAEDLVRGVVVGPGVEKYLGMDRGDLAVGCGTKFRVDTTAVAFVMANNRLFAAPLCLHRPVHAERCQLLHCDCHDDLHRHVFAAAECTTDRRIDDPHLGQVQPERVCNLLLIFVGPLTGNLDSQTT